MLLNRNFAMLCYDVPIGNLNTGLRGNCFINEKFIDILKYGNAIFTLSTAKPGQAKNTFLVISL